MPLSPEDIAYAKQMGYSDAQIAQANYTDQQPTNGNIGTLGTIGDTARAHIGSYAGGGLGAIGGGALVGALGGSEVPIAGNIIGGLLGALAGAYGGQKLQQGIDPNYEQAQAAAQQAAEQNPITAGATDIAGSALASGGMFSPTTALKGLRSIIGRLGGTALDDAGKQVLLQGALNPAINTGLSLAQGQGIPSLQDLATQAVGGSLFAKSWLPHGETVTPAPDEPKSEVNNSTKLLGDAIEPKQLGWNEPDFTRPPQPKPTVISTGEPIEQEAPDIKGLLGEQQKLLPAPRQPIALLNAPLEHLDEVNATLLDGKEVDGHIIGTDEKSGNPILLDSATLQQHILPEKEYQDAIQKQSTSSILPHPQTGVGEAGSERVGVGQGNQGSQPAGTQSQEEQRLQTPTNQQVERDPTLHLPYSPEDLAKYREMQPKTVPKSLEEYSSPEFQSRLREYEALRNKYNGNPPLQVLEEKAAAKTKSSEPPNEPPKPPITGNTSSSPQELNLPRDKYMSKVGNIFRSVLDKIRDIGTPEAKHLGDNMQRAVDRETELKGRWKNAIVQGGEKLTGNDKTKLMEAFNHELETGQSGITILKTPEQRQFYNLARQKLDESGKYRLAIGEPVTQAIKTKNGGNAYVKRSLIQDQHYFPGMANQKVLDVYRKGIDHAEMARLDKEFHDYNTKKLGLSEEASNERVENFKKSVQGSLQKSDISHQDYFNAHRKAQGTPLPPTFREHDPVRNLERYFDRAAVDASHYEFLEKDPSILSTLGQTKDAWGNDVPKSGNVLANNQAVKAGLEHWRGEAVSPAEQNESSLSSLVSSSFIAGPALELHKVISNVVKTLANTSNPLVLTHAITHGMGNIMKGYQHALENGVVKLTARSASQMLSANSTAAERLQAAARTIRRIATLNDLTTKFGAGLVQSMNEVIVPSKVVRANAGDVTSQMFIRRLDPTYYRGKEYSQQEMQQLASRSANYIHGTGDIRSLPAWMLNDSEFSGFFSLAHWSIAQTNNFMKDVYEPATRGDIKPLLTGIFGAAIGGYLIKELRQDIQGKKNPIPSLQEIASSDKGLSGNKGLLAYNMIAAMQYSGFGGLLSQVAKYPFDAVYKNNPQGATFPLDEVASDLAGTLHNVSEALANDPNANWLDLSKQVAMHVLSTDFQLSRIAINKGIDAGLITGMPAEKKELSDKLGQLRRFDMVEGLPYNDIDEGSNPYMNLEQKKFKMNQDLSSSAQELPDLIHGIISKYSANPDVMMQKIKSLKQNPYSTFPSMEDTPLSFFKYLSYLSREEGPAKAQAELMDYYRHKVVNEAKSSLVP